MKKTYIIAILGIFVLGGGVWTFVIQRDNNPSYESLIVEKRDLTQEVRVTGRVEPAEKVELAFEKTGRIARIFVDVGSRVQADQELAQLDQAEPQAELAQATAKLKIELAVLDELRRGTRQEEIQVQEVKVANAKSALTEEEQQARDTIRTSYTKTDDGISNKIDQMFNNPKSFQPKLSFTTQNPQLKNDVEFQRLLLQPKLSSWNASIIQLTQRSDLAVYLQEARDMLSEVKLFLDIIADLVNETKASTDISQATLNQYRADVSAVRSTVDTEISNISTAQEKLQDATAVLRLAEQELRLKISRPLLIYR